MTTGAGKPRQPKHGQNHHPKVKQEALRLRRSGMAAKAIADKLRRKYGIRLAKVTVQRWGDDADAEQAPYRVSDVAVPPDFTPVLPHTPAPARNGTALASEDDGAGPATPRLIDASYGQPEASAGRVTYDPVETPAEADDPDLAIPTGLDGLRAVYRQQLALAKVAQREGNVAAAGKALKAATEAANTIARLEAKAGPGDAAAVTLTEEHAAQNRATARELARKYAEDLQRTDGPVCAECGRRLRIELASRPGDAPTPPH